MYLASLLRNESFDHVRFYFLGHEVDPPWYWEPDVDIWTAYAKRIASKWGDFKRAHAESLLT